MANNGANESWRLLRVSINRSYSRRDAAAERGYRNRTRSHDDIDVVIRRTINKESSCMMKRITADKCTGIMAAAKLSEWILIHQSMF